MGIIYIFFYFKLSCSFIAPPLGVVFSRHSLTTLSLSVVVSLVGVVDTPESVGAAVLLHGSAPLPLPHGSRSFSFLDSNLCT
ncbi:hypothetical protein HanIR_Chr09g0426511 [Helianthus annuus]|nr:hypothetical protein HanIR_Chr09g0426511 [Helianthus annuus]